MDFLRRIFGKETERTAKTPRISITSVNIKFMGNSHGINGMDVDGDKFEMKIPFRNRMGSEHLPDNLRGPKVKISKVTVAEPFKLLGIEPALPVDVEYMSSVMFTLTIKPPEMKYEGPMEINFGNEPADTVNINIKKVVLHYKGHSADMESSEIVTNMQKFQLFRQNIQLYQIISLGDTVTHIEAGKPFEVVSTDPKLPIKADRKDSYIISLFIKGPDFSYAGNLDLMLE